MIVELGGERAWLGWRLPPPEPPAKGEPVGPETLVPVAPPVDNPFVVVLDDAQSSIQSKLDPSAPVTTRAPASHRRSTRPRMQRSQRKCATRG